MDNSVNQFPVRVLAVIVLYKMQPSESVSYSTLRAAMSALSDGQADIKIVLYDNTPGGQDIGELPDDLLFKADFENGGLATAYNYALEIAHEEGFDWLLTLDQDTTLPIDFLLKLCHTAAFVAPLPNVAAIVPHISSDGQVLSPFIRMKHLTLTKKIPDGFIGIPTDNVYAVNSASTIKVSALKGVGGYDPRFNLDFSDLAIYHRLHCHGLRVFVAGNIYVEHEVSGYDLKNRSTPGRYEDFCRAEETAYDEWVGGVARVLLAVRIFHRLVYRLWRNNGSLPYFKICLRFFCRRLFYSRNYRIENWKPSAGLRSRV
jgi:GT2 family glycosyltransferase